VKRSRELVKECRNYLRSVRETLDAEEGKEEA